MRVLILSANTGGGHNSTAYALAEQFEKINVECEVLDTLSIISEKVSNFVSWGHSYVYRKMPKLFGTAYRYEERHAPRKIYEYFAKGAVTLQEKLLSECFDAVISVHVFGGMMMTEVRRRFKNPIPNYFVATDYTCSPGVGALDVDSFFIPHRMLFGEFIRAMIPADRLYATGIPVKSNFYEKRDRLEARRSLGIHEDGRVVLLGGGSIGCGNLNRHALELANRLPRDVTLVVLCGKNEELANDLSRFSSDTFIVVGYTKDISVYMSAADIYLTKPGGLMTTEAIVKGLPMVFVDAVPGCETRNFEFLSSNQVAEGSKNWKQAINRTLRMLEQPEAMEKQRLAMEDFHHGIAAEQICGYVARKR